MNIIKHKKIPFTISAVLFVVSLILLITIGLKPGIDFTGGSLIELTFTDSRPAISEIQEVFSEMDLGDVLVQPTEEKGVILKMQFINEKQHQEILKKLRDKFEANTSEVVEEIDGTVAENNLEIKTEGNGNLEIGVVDAVEVGAEEGEDVQNKVREERIETIGPAISSQLRSRAFYAAIAVILAIVLYVAYAFRKVSKPVKSWKYGVAAIIALVHDVTLVLGVFVLLGKFLGIEIGIPFVVALLTILGYSVNDTIVVFDRVRENLIKRGSDRFSETVNLGVVQSITRSINTSVTTLVVLSALFLFGGETIKYFALALIIGVASGTYSSIFLASPLLVVWEKLKNRRV